MDSTALLDLGRLYAAHVGISLSTAGRRLANHGAFFSRLETGHTITQERAKRVGQNISHHWPADLEWPAAIPRPTPLPYISLWTRRGRPRRMRRAGRSPPWSGTPGRSGWLC